MCSDFIQRPLPVTYERPSNGDVLHVVEIMSTGLLDQPRSPIETLERRKFMVKCYVLSDQLGIVMRLPSRSDHE